MLNCLRLNQNLMHLLYITHYITFFYAFGHMSAPSSGSQIQCNVIRRIGGLNIGLGENN